MEVRFYSAIEEIGEARWQSLAKNDYPFIQYAFLHALESAGDLRLNTAGATGSEQVACDAASGWQPHHLAVIEGDTTVALLPNYLKFHSYGEYIFDWAWADAYRRQGMDYYPKLLGAIPFTPVGGPRLLIAGDYPEDEICSLVARALREECEQRELSSFHLLYPEQAYSEMLARDGLLQRHSFQYHWFNRNIHNGDKPEPYGDFDEFLQTLKSRKRKAIRKERKSVTEQQIQFRWLEGEQIEDQHWQQFYHYYQLTYARRSGHGGYLPLAFFKAIGKSMPQQLCLLMASDSQREIAGALFFKSQDTLYGRYWGCLEQAEFLHFETCIYRGIDYCIEHGLKRFDAGAQGEHKLQRGFEPVSCWSNHWVAHPGFRDAIARYIAEEKQQNLGYMERAEDFLPYRCS